MKKKKITTPLVLKKSIIVNLGAVVSGGGEPATMPVKTYRCPTCGPPCTTPDPLPNLQSCECGMTTFQNTYIPCTTRPGHICG
ncbi:hypothetical protein [Chitinophaga solisilvae]|uniref:hypothetical protein n=1 Tax=Chitinophaga solisilvae TaxID=1233460 RepID=UPI00136FFC4F|nr:hypothetical protein [Chitinophaga solisilvae]